MKFLTFLFCIVSFNACAVEVKKQQKKIYKKEMSFTSLPCKQKILPVMVKYQTTDRQITIVFVAEGKIKKFEVVRVSGLDEMKIISSEIPEIKDLVEGDVVEIKTEFDAPEGLSYLSIDIKGLVNSSEKYQNLAIPFGEITPEQQLLNRKDVRNGPERFNKSGSDSSSDKIHTMKLQSKKKALKNP